ncbi:MAG: hypothetical protein LC742_11760 [Acidobacteria bacterium]|nr:hypothetical protein [Acidobacteriota bacterium]
MAVACCQKRRAAWRRLAGAALISAFASVLGACAAASRTPDPARPRTNEPPYPVVLPIDPARREQANAAWAALSTDGRANATAAPELQPVTATIRALPPDATLRLPSVQPAGEGEEAAQEARRESLRRFLRDAAPLLGVELSELSLIEVTEQNGTRRARYQQRPFPHPLRGGYGVIEIAFTPDLRVTSLSSTALPDTERLARAINAPRTRLTTEETAQRLAGRAVTYTDASGSTQTVTLTSGGETAVRELVIYPIRAATDPAALELHLAWEVSVGSAPQLNVYLDAVTGEIVATELATGG